ncbi:MAG: copper chaperone PCu(A)C [Defluviicoccus sp.]|nr:copper chaperone PCu(A)C [Defluviicoccus sp.]
MRNRLIALTAAFVALAFVTAAFAHDYTLGDLRIDHPWARASAGAAANGAAYMSIATTGTAADQLVKADSPVADKVELHTHILDGDVMRMRPVSGITVNVGEPAVLRPGGLHVMLIGLKEPLKQGTQFPLTLTFEKAGTVTVQVEVEAASMPTEPMQHKH